MNAFLTTYTDLVFRVARHTIVGHPERTVGEYGPPRPGQVVTTRRLEFLSTDKPFELAVDDYDARPEDDISRYDAAVLDWFQRHIPVHDAGRRWPDIASADRAFTALFGAILPARSLGIDDPDSDETLTWLCTQSLAAHRLERAPGGYRLPLAWMQKYEVRPGVARVGCDAWFDDDLRPTRIEGFRGHTVTPGDSDWPLAKYAFRSAAVLCATLLDHAVFCHAIVANSIAVSTRRSLPADHPIRRLLAPFHLKSIGIDHLAGTVLLGEGALLNRLTGFTWDGLRAVYRDGQRVRLETVPESLQRRGTTGLGARYPWAEDALPLWDALLAFITDYLALYYDAALRGDGRQDADLATWTADLRALWPWSGDAVRRLDDRASLAETLAALLFVATAFHRQIAVPVDFARDPRFYAQTMPADATTVEELWPTAEKSTANLLLVCLTAPRGPRLMQDFSHFFLDEPARALVPALYARLEAASAGVAVRNQGRRVPMRAFDPKTLQISIST